MRIMRSGSQPSRPGLAENFTGSVLVDPLFPGERSGARIRPLVAFESVARTADWFLLTAARLRPGSFLECGSLLLWNGCEVNCKT
jgi:hypothetical protein